MPAAKLGSVLRAKLVRDIAPKLVPSTPFGSACWLRLKSVAGGRHQLGFERGHNACGWSTRGLWSLCTLRVESLHGACTLTESNGNCHSRGVVPFRWGAEATYLMMFLPVSRPVCVPSAKDATCCDRRGCRPGQGPPPRLLLIAIHDRRTGRPTAGSQSCFTRASQLSSGRNRCTVPISNTP